MENNPAYWRRQPNLLPFPAIPKTANTDHCSRWGVRPGSQMTTRWGSWQRETSRRSASHAGCCDASSAAFLSGRRKLETGLIVGKINKFTQNAHLWKHRAHRQCERGTNQARWFCQKNVWHCVCVSWSSFHRSRSRHSFCIWIWGHLWGTSDSHHTWRLRKQDTEMERPAPEPLLN